MTQRRYRHHIAPLVQAVEEVAGFRPHVSAVIRWKTRGSRGVRLEAYLCGGRWLASSEAVRRFIEATTQAKVGELPQPTSTPRQTNQAAQRSAKQLAKRLAT